MSDAFHRAFFIECDDERIDFNLRRLTKFITVIGAHSSYNRLKQ